VSLARNLDVEFRLGWHGLRNMDSEIGPWSLAKRDVEERRFFSEDVWRTLPESILGIAPLRERLSRLLLSQIAAELPSLIEEIENKSATCRTRLQRLGQPRASIEEQRLYLINLGQTFQALTKAAVDGTYNTDFFGDAKTDTGYRKRMRAVVQNLNQSFAENMTRKGHKYTIISSSDDNDAKENRSAAEVLTRDRFLDHVEDLIKRTRGCELPGTFNPMIISDLFAEQSRPWGGLAKKHIEQVADAVMKFLRHLVSHIADSSTGDTLFQKMVEPALEAILRSAKCKTNDILAPLQKGHPITYNHYFTETVQHVKRERARMELTRIMNDTLNIKSLDPVEAAPYTRLDYRPLLEALMEHTNPDMSRYACSEALDCMQAYYKVCHSAEQCYTAHRQALVLTSITSIRSHSSASSTTSLSKSSKPPSSRN
jgi:hypothetical protein